MDYQWKLIIFSGAPIGTKVWQYRTGHYAMKGERTSWKFEKIMDYVTHIFLRTLGQYLAFKTIWAFLDGLEPKLQNFKKLISKVLRYANGNCRYDVASDRVTLNFSCPYSVFLMDYFKNF